jgi:hypothetical protein
VELIQINRNYYSFNLYLFIIERTNISWLEISNDTYNKFVIPLLCLSLLLTSTQARWLGLNANAWCFSCLFSNAREFICVQNLSFAGLCTVSGELYLWKYFYKIHNCVIEKSFLYWFIWYIIHFILLYMYILRLHF